MTDVLVDFVFSGGAKITGLPDATVDSAPATFGQMRAAIEGISWKDAVRVASTANVTLSGPGTSIDAITLANNDRVLLKNQTSGLENGIYIFNGSAVPMTRAPDASTFDEMEGAVVTVEEGTANIGTAWRQSAVNGVIDVNNIAWTSFLSGAAAASESVAGIAEIATQVETDTGTDDARFVTPLKLKNSKFFNKSFSQTVGDASATSFNIDHNLGTRDVQVIVYKNSGNYDDVIADYTRTTANRVVVTFASAPASNAYRVVIQGTQV